MLGKGARMAWGGRTDIRLSFCPLLSPYRCWARKTKATLQLGYVLDSTNHNSSVGWVTPGKHTLCEDLFLISFLFNTTMAVKYPISAWTKGFHFAEENKKLLNQNENQKMSTSDCKKYVILPQPDFFLLRSVHFFWVLGFFNWFGGRTEKVKHSKGVRRSDSIYKSNWYRWKKQTSLQAQKGCLFLPALSAGLIKAIPSSSKILLTYLLSLSWLQEYIYWNSSY